VRLAACHHDLHHRNFIDDGRRLLAVDWEYAGPGDPAADLASCIGYNGLRADGIDALLAGYGHAGAELRERVAQLAWIFDCLWFGWNAAAGLAGSAPDANEQASLEARLAQ
jgi:thiamine kinase-like enzyme